MRNAGPLVPAQTGDYLKYSVGRNGAGTFSLTGVKSGDVIRSVALLGNPGGGGANTITSAFTILIAANDTVTQTSATDYSASGLLFLISASGGGA